MLDALVTWFNERTTTEIVWLGIGTFAQLLFSMRFVVQWIASEKVRRSIVPETFWYFSMGGGIMLLAYSIHRVDPVFILGQAMGVVIYSRNIYFIHTHRKNGSAVEPDVRAGAAKP